MTHFSLLPDPDPAAAALLDAIEAARAASYALTGATFRLAAPPPAEIHPLLDAIAADLQFSPLGPHWVEVPRRIGVKILAHIIGEDLAYPEEIVPAAEAAALAERALALLAPDARCFTNGAISGNFAVYDRDGGEVVGWRSLSDAPLDNGLIAVDTSRAIILWAEDAP